MKLVATKLQCRKVLFPYFSSAFVLISKKLSSKEALKFKLYFIIHWNTVLRLFLLLEKMFIFTLNVGVFFILGIPIQKNHQYQNLNNIKKTDASFLALKV